MPKSLKIALVILGMCYSFSLGMFCSHIYSRVQQQRALVQGIQNLNRLSDQRRELIGKMRSVLIQDPDFIPATKHLLAVEQLTPHYSIDNALIKIQEDRSLRNFTISFYQQLSTYSKALEAMYLSQELLKLEIEINKKQNEVISSLTIE